MNINYNLKVAASVSYLLLTALVIEKIEVYTPIDIFEYALAGVFTLFILVGIWFTDNIYYTYDND